MGPLDSFFGQAKTQKLSQLDSAQALGVQRETDSAALITPKLMEANSINLPNLT